MSLALTLVACFLTGYGLTAGRRSYRQAMTCWITACLLNTTVTIMRHAVVDACIAAASFAYVLYLWWTDGGGSGSVRRRLRQVGRRIRDARTPPVTTPAGGR